MTPEQARERGEYWLELTVLDGAGKQFGTKTSVPVENAERIIAEVGRSAALFVAGTDEFDRQARERYGFTEIA
jgi:hypothetical protein